MIVRESLEWEHSTNIYLSIFEEKILGIAFYELLSKNRYLSFKQSVMQRKYIKSILDNQMVYCRM